MPLGKYFCDYCEEFQDNPHLRGDNGQHLRARAQCYASFKDPNHAYTESLTKGVCNRFVNMGSRSYGDSCKYLHPNNNQQDTVLIDTINLRLFKRISRLEAALCQMWWSEIIRERHGAIYLHP